jgi:hypothetical protein
MVVGYLTFPSRLPRHEQKNQDCEKHKEKHHPHVFTSQKMSGSPGERGMGRLLLNYVCYYNGNGEATKFGKYNPIYPQLRALFPFTNRVFHPIIRQKFSLRGSP